MMSMKTILTESLEADGTETNKPYKICEVCNEPMEKDRMILGKWRRTYNHCACAREEMDRILKEDEEREKQAYLDRIFENSFMDKKFKNATFKNWDHNKGDEKLYNITSKYALNYKKAIENNLGLYIFGKPGNGKSYAACSIGNHLLSSGVPIVCISINKLLERIKETYNSPFKEDEDRILRGFSKGNFLIIDDLGTELKSEWTTSRIYKIIDERYRSELPTVITSNLNLRELAQRYDERVADRIGEMCTRISCNGGSIREEVALVKNRKMAEIVGGK